MEFATTAPPVYQRGERGGEGGGAGRGGGGGGGGVPLDEIAKSEAPYYSKGGTIKIPIPAEWLSAPSLF